MIECRDLTKKYNELFAVDRLTLKLESGDVYGFIGPNGSGKTTTMRMLATLLNPSWGEATVCGYSIYTGSKEIRRSIGYMPGGRKSNRSSITSTLATSATRW
jgi:ABC-2 type transport system ATP-binding protein